MLTELMISTFDKTNCMQLYFLYDEHTNNLGGLIYIAIALMVLITIKIILVEAVVMALMKYNSFKRSLKDSALINLASAIVVVLLSFILPGAFEPSEIVGIAGLLVIPVLLESFLLHLRNKEKAITKTVTVSLVMNIVSYLILFAISKS